MKRRTRARATEEYGQGVRLFRGIALSTATLCAISTPFVLFPKTTPAWVSVDQIIAAILFFPIGLASICLCIFGACNFRSWKRDLFFPLLTCVSLIFPGTLGINLVSQKIGREMSLAEEVRRNDWFSYGEALNPLIIEYVRQHPERVSFPFQDDRAMIDGLGNYLASKTTIPIRGDSVLDPWGEVVLIVIDREKDMKLQFEDNFYGVYNAQGNSIAVSLFAQSPNSLARHFNEQWQITNGVIPNEQPQ